MAFLLLSVQWAALLFLLAVVHEAWGAGFLKIEGIDGESVNPADSGKEHDKWIVIESMSTGVNREERFRARGGTQDINIGVGELQELSISKRLDASSAHLARAAISGEAFEGAEIEFVEVGGGGLDGTAGEPVAYLRYKMDRVFVKSWSTSGDADDRPTEEVAFYYNKIAFAYRTLGTEMGSCDAPYFGWDLAGNLPWNKQPENAKIHKNLEPLLPREAGRDAFTPGNRRIGDPRDGY